MFLCDVDCLQDMFRGMPACCIVIYRTLKFCVVYLHILKVCVCHNLTSKKKYLIFIPIFYFLPLVPVFFFRIISSFLSYSLHTSFPSFLFLSFFQSPVSTSLFSFSSLYRFLPCHFSTCIYLISAISLFLCLYELGGMQLRSPDVVFKWLAFVRLLGVMSRVHISTYRYHLCTVCGRIQILWY
jgi:hypothetical protein